MALLYPVLAGSINVHVLMRSYASPEVYLISICSLLAESFVFSSTANRKLFMKAV